MDSTGDLSPCIKPPLSQTAEQQVSLEIDQRDAVRELKIQSYREPKDKEWGTNSPLNLHQAAGHVFSPSKSAPPGFNFPRELNLSPETKCPARASIFKVSPSIRTNSSSQGKSHRGDHQAGASSQSRRLACIISSSGPAILRPPRDQLTSEWLRQYHTGQQVDNSDEVGVRPLGHTQSPSWDDPVFRKLILKSRKQEARNRGSPDQYENPSDSDGDEEIQKAPPNTTSARFVVEMKEREQATGEEKNRQGTQTPARKIGLEDKTKPSRISTKIYSAFRSPCLKLIRCMQGNCP